MMNVCVHISKGSNTAVGNQFVNAIVKCEIGLCDPLLVVQVLLLLLVVAAVVIQEQLVHRVVIENEKEIVTVIVTVIVIMTETETDVERGLPVETTEIVDVTAAIVATEIGTGTERQVVGKMIVEMAAMKRKRILHPTVTVTVTVTGIVTEPEIEFRRKSPNKLARVCRRSLRRTEDPEVRIWRKERSRMTFDVSNSCVGNNIYIYHVAIVVVVVVLLIYLN